MKRLFAVFVIVVFLFSMIGCEEPRESNSNLQPQNKLSNELIYNWLLENGELSNGTTLSYTINYMSGCVLSVTAAQDKEVKISFVSLSSNGLSTTCSIPLISDSLLSFVCKITDQTNTGKAYKCKLEANDFTSSSPIEIADTTGFYFDGEFFNHIWSSKGKYYLEYFSQPAGKVVQEEISQVKLDVIDAIDDISPKLAQESVCNMLDFMSKDLCPLWGVELSDLGYKKYSPSNIVESI